MDKKILIENLKEMAEKKIISREDLFSIIDEVFPEKFSEKNLNAPIIFSYIGGLIVFLGIFLLVLTNWSLLSIKSKTIISLGTGIGFYISGLLLINSLKYKLTGHIFIFLSALLLPIGVYTFFSFTGFGGIKLFQNIIIPGILFITYILSYRITKSTIFLFFSIFFGSWLFWGIVFALHPERITKNWVPYALISMGICHILIGYAFSKDKKILIGNFLYICGLSEFLGSCLSLCGSLPYDNIFWEITFPILNCIIIFLSTRLKNLVFLALGILFLVIYILKITFDFFPKGSLNWAISLVIIGFTVIIMGTTFQHVYKKYFS